MRANVLFIGALLLGTSVSAQDLDNCAKADVILSTVVANLADCGQKFIASVSATELQPFCSLLFDGLECVAGKLAPEKKDECFDRMIQFVENDPSAVFDQIQPILAAMGENIELRFVNQVGECNIYKTLGNCVNIGVIVQTVVANVADCGKTFIDSVSATELQSFCSLLFDGLECVAGKLAPKNDGLCFKRMAGYVKDDPGALFDQIKPLLASMGQQIDLPFANQVGECNANKDGNDDDEDSDDKDDDDKDEDWNTACPKIENEGGLCPQSDCTADTDCQQTPPKHTCCKVGGEQCNQCIPDMRQCGDIKSIFANDDVKVSCVAQLAMTWKPGNASDYCRFIWKLVDCFSEKIMPGTYQKLCFERMAKLLEDSQLDLVRALQKANNAIKIADIARYLRTDDCEENPLRKQPERPEPNDVKTCFNKTNILNAAGQCGRLTGSSATNVNCKNLNDYIECIAKKLTAGKNDNVVRKCTGEVYEFVKRNQGNLPNSFGNISPQSCQERMSACGYGLSPLDGAQCKTARCPATYVCKQGLCCPKVKMGYCPKVERGDRPICKKSCKMDSECEEDEKCCEGCGRKTCMKMETEDDSDKSKCEELLEEGKKQLASRGICGDGTVLTKLPRCQNKRFSPLQMVTETGRGYCVTEDGRKINGSDFTGNRDCTKVREGSCPPTPAECQTVSQNADTCLSNDFKCANGQKCCTFYEGGTCLTKCVAAQKAREPLADDCQDRKCCPLTLCDNKICLKDRTAVCSINSCGKCEAEFYNLKGEKIDCNAGVPLCLRQRAAAREENANRRTTEYEMISFFMKSRDNREMRNGKDDDDDEDGDYDDDDDEDDDEDNDDDDDDMEKDDEYRRDEYGIERQEEDKLPDDNVEDNDDDMEKSHAMMEALKMKLCEVFDNFDICQNGGTCQIGSGESFWEVCKCPTGFSGLFCETTGPVSPRDTMCNRDRQRISTISAIMMGSEHMKEKMVLQEMFNRFKPPQKIMSTFTCDAAGNYQQIQMGTTLPKTLHSIQIYYCVDTTTGMRIRGTPVTMVDSGVMPDCTITTALPDIMGLPRICMVRNTTRCSNDDECQYFWNQEEGTCDKGKAMGGFNRLTDCYDKCSIQKGCTNDPNGDRANTDGFVCQKGVISGPKPCRMEDSNGAEYDTCDYERQFCEVEDTASGHIGMCKTFPRRCLDGPESGYGGRTVGAYYFNTKTRTCNKFLYRGMGGNLNRYYHLKQCHTECSTRMYKFDDAVCPIPKMLEMSMDEVSNCDSDEDCEGESVCCFNGKGRICTSPVRTCSSGLRCSLFGSCSGDQCVCDDCTDVPLSQVCGTDGQTYPSLCHMKRKSCQVMQNITKAFDGPCKTKCGETEYCEKYEICENNVCKCPEFCTTDFNPVCAKGAKSRAMCTYSNECVMNMAACKMKERFVILKDGKCSPDDSSGTCRLQCTREYMPICVYDTTDTTPVQNTYGNGCLLKEAMLNGRKLQVLSPGPCSRKCGTTEQCPFYKACMDGVCKCADACSTNDYRPICAHPQGNNAKPLTFTNICLMNQRVCSEDKLYIIVKHGPCKEPEPVLECPKTMDDIPFSATAECKTENNEGCDTEMGEVCCSYGAGKKCIAKKDLERVKIDPKQGICPAISGLNFDEAMCDSYKCMEDSDCAGIDTKCCPNSKCGHMTCSVPLVKQEESPCASGSKMVSECDPSAEVTGCVKGGTCTVALTNPEKVSVCCVPSTQEAGVEKEIYEAHFCKLLATAGITCANGGTCVGNIRDGKVCQCKTGFFGPFCRDYVPTNCKIQAACVANPCDVTKCPGVPDATCSINTCETCSAVFKRGTENVNHLCHSTPCFVQRAVMKALAESIYKESDTSDDEDDMETNPFKHMLMYLMSHIGMPAEPVIYEDLCTATGQFKPEQCIRGMGDAKRCYCVNTQTGMPILNGPKVTSLEGLNCGALNEGNNSGLQEFCFKQPSKKRCSAPSKRYFFNTRTMDCEQFLDYGCDFENGNNFVNYKTCKTACGVMTSALSKCAAARSRCGSGKQCRVVDGNAVCVDPDNVPAKFEPICDADGNFHAKQCHGDICKCVNPTTGDTISNSEAHGQNLTCKKDGNNVKPNRTKQIVCEGNQAAVFCANDGDICNNCELGADRENQRSNNDEKVDDQNVCKSCKRCTSSQGKQTCKTENLCVNTCKGFPKAVCRINKCTCREEYFANGKVVNCSALHGNCEKEKHNSMLEEKVQALRNNGNVPENSRQIKCSESQTYLAACRGNKCQCLDPTDGTEVGEVQTGKTLDTIDCTSVQNEKKTKRANIKAVLSKVKNLNQLNQRQQDALKSNVKKKIEDKYAVIVNKVTLKTGSIFAEIELEACETTECLNSGSTTDVVTITNDITTSISQGEFSVDADGETFVASEATVEFQTGPTTEPTPMDDDDDDDNKTTVIIVVVVVVVVCIVAIAVAFYCYKKANKSSNKDIPFSDIQGKNNPGYERP